MEEINKLVTEGKNSSTKDIDRLSSLQVVRKINEEDKKVAYVVERELEKIAEAIDRIAPRFDAGGRLIYLGAGSSGRMGMMDAAELIPTYGIPSERVISILAGGKRAINLAVEGAEDDGLQAEKDLELIHLTEKDTLIAIAASGRTPYTLHAIQYAKQCGSLSIAITSNPCSLMAMSADVAITPVVGSEVIAGSTRMKAGTAQKMVLNMLSTGVMIKLGKVFQNQMVNVQATNEKLKSRAQSIITNITGVEKAEAEELLDKAENNVAVAIVMKKASVDKITAQSSLEEVGYHVRRAIDSIQQ